MSYLIKCDVEHCKQVTAAEQDFAGQMVLPAGWCEVKARYSRPDPVASTKNLLKGFFLEGDPLAKAAAKYTLDMTAGAEQADYEFRTVCPGHDLPKFAVDFSPEAVVDPAALAQIMAAAGVKRKDEK